MPAAVNPKLYLLMIKGRTVGNHLNRRVVVFPVAIPSKTLHMTASNTSVGPIFTKKKFVYPSRLLPMDKSG